MPQPAIEVRARRGQALGMAPARFLADYWQKRPLLVRGAFPGWRDPLQPEDLAGLACEELALARIVIEHRAAAGKRGRAAGPSRWELRSGPFEEGEFARLPASHWTLLVQDVDKWDADVAALLGHFTFLPSWRIDDVMISYAVEGGSVGAHVDQYDVFLVQGLGRRRWEIDVDPAAPRGFRSDTELKLLETFTPSHSWELAPGDLLYLPPGVPHHGIALEPCMTFSVGTRAPAQAELLVDLADHLAASLPEEARYADADLAPARAPGEIDAAAIARLRAALPWVRTDGHATDPGGIEEATLRRWFGSFITRYRSAQLTLANPRALTDAAFARALAGNAQVRRNPWSRVAWLREGRRARLFVAGEGHPCSLAFARLVAGAAGFGLAQVPAAEDRAVLRQLLDAGHFALLRSRRATPAS
ncbi:JmjC domain-containing protein [Dokdonella sp.]|uniref:JmjC domain-containing protein n=1 Tax=Dokdonella sp. TaxID=2291710 RepID=UPI0031C750D3|nr:cupin domain-containing protein [Dokdonella sp.]